MAAVNCIQKGHLSIVCNISELGILWTVDEHWLSWFVSKFKIGRLFDQTYFPNMQNMANWIPRLWRIFPISWWTSTTCKPTIISENSRNSASRYETYFSLLTHQLLLSMMICSVNPLTKLLISNLAHVKFLLQIPSVVTENHIWNKSSVYQNITGETHAVVRLLTQG